MDKFKEGFMQGFGCTLGASAAGISVLLVAHLVLMISEKISRFKKHSK